MAAEDLMCAHERIYFKSLLKYSAPVSLEDLLLEASSGTYGTVLVGHNVFCSVIASTEWQEFFVPTVKHDALIRGHLGNVGNISMYTDAYRHPELKALSDNDSIILVRKESMPLYHPVFEYAPRSQVMIRTLQLKAPPTEN
jgi:hypothetical protein